MARSSLSGVVKLKAGDYIETLPGIFKNIKAGSLVEYDQKIKKWKIDWGEGWVGWLLDHQFKLHNGNKHLPLYFISLNIVAVNQNTDTLYGNHKFTGSITFEYGVKTYIISSGIVDTHSKVSSWLIKEYNKNWTSYVK